MAARIHYAEDPISLSPPACRRVPGWADCTRNERQVTCRWCLRLLAALPELQDKAGEGG